MIIKQGDRVINSIGDEYIVAQIDYNLYALISVSDGNRYTDPVKLENMANGVYIRDLIGDDPDTSFTKIEDSRARMITVAIHDLIGAYIDQREHPMIDDYIDRLNKAKSVLEAVLWS